MAWRPDRFFDSLQRLPPPRCLDLLDISAGMYAVDRIARRPGKQDGSAGSRELELEFSVRDPHFWQEPANKKLLTSTLEFLTCDELSLTFKQASDGPTYQTYLEALPRQFQPSNVALFSGGLDSAAGLANRILRSGANDYLLVTVGHQSGLGHRARLQLFGGRQSDGLGAIAADLGIGDIRMHHSALIIRLRGGRAKRVSMQERSQRSRPFLFCASAAIAAWAYGVERVEMFENGIGAINLPLMSGMLGTPLATRSSHPTFLRLMSQLCSRVTESSLRFVLPFKHLTKAEMLRPLVHPRISNWLQSSLSCVHGPIRQQGKTHCGRCPACIERSQAFAAAGIDEDRRIYQWDALARDQNNWQGDDYLQLYRHAAHRWLARDPASKRKMRSHLRLTGIASASEPTIFALHDRHANEVLNIFGQAFFSPCSQQHNRAAA